MKTPDNIPLPDLPTVLTQRTPLEISCADGVSLQQSDPFDTAYLMNDLKGRSVRGGMVTVAAQGCSFAIRMGSTVVLARMLTPDDFGLIAMVTVLIGFAAMFSDLGLSMATIQGSNITHSQISNLFWVNVVVSFLITSILLIAAPGFSWFYGDPRLTPITRALAGAFVLGGLRVQHRALLQRQMRFTALGAIDITAMGIGVASAIVAALYGAGYWSLVIMAIATELVATFSTWVACPWRPGLPNRRTGTNTMLRFGGDVTGFNIVNYFSRNLDNILIGRFIGAAALGFYSKAYALLMLPLDQINAPISAVAIPALSRLTADPERYRRFYLKTIRLISLVTAPPIAFSIFFADDLIRIVLGEQWRPSAFIYTLLGLSALAQPLYNTQGWLHLTTGHSRRYFRWGVIGAVVFSGAFAVGVAFSAEGVALAYTIAFIAILPFCMSYAGRSAGIQLKDIARASGWPMLWALCTAGSVKIITMSFSTSWSPIPRVALAAVTGTAITLIWITRISPDLLQQVRRFLSVRDGSGQEREV
jgi:O-antigen/teichoic acid export membrane protein